MTQRLEVSVSDARMNLAQLIDLVRTKHERVRIKKNGRLFAAIVSVEDLELLEKIHREKQP